jgi:membrane fusion protein (multidrug efflux system)
VRKANEAKLNLSYTKVVAPIDGVTGMAAKSNGSLITSADSLLTTIVQTDTLYVNFSIPESDYLKVSKEVNGKVAVPGKVAKNGSIGFDVKLKLADGSMFPRRAK